MIIISHMLESKKAVTGKYFVMTSIDRNHVRGCGQGDTPQCVCGVIIFKWYDQPKTTSNLIAMKLKWIIYIYIIYKYYIIIEPHNIWNSNSPRPTESLMQNYSYGHWFLRIHTKEVVIEIISLRQFSSSSPGQNGRHLGRRHSQTHFCGWKSFWRKCHWRLFIRVQLIIPQN